MMAIMYHYVRPNPGQMVHLKYLGLDDFRRQLDYLEREEGLMDLEGFLRCVETRQAALRGAILTFDDGFRDHMDYVVPELLARKKWGIFYIPTGYYQNGKMHNAHRVHYLLGRFGGEEVLDRLTRLIEPRQLAVSDEKPYRKAVYQGQKVDRAATKVKRMINFDINHNEVDSILDHLMAQFCDQREVASSYYLTVEEIREIHQSGMIIGSHGCSHSVMSKLDLTQQDGEIRESFDFLEKVTGGLRVRTFCYPHGQPVSFTADTEKLLEKNNSAFSFAVGGRDITTADLAQRPQALPRYDCRFIHPC